MAVWRIVVDVNNRGSYNIITTYIALCVDSAEHVW